MTKTVESGMRIALCMLSIVLIWTIGMLGQGALDLPCFTAIRSAPVLPWLTEFFLTDLHIRYGGLMLSLTPFMVLMIGVAWIASGSSRAKLFWYLFVCSWLLTLIYVLAFASAMLIPLDPLALLSLIPPENPLGSTITRINTILAISLIGVGIFIRTRAKERSPRD